MLFLYSDSAHWFFWKMWVSGILMYVPSNYMVFCYIWLPLGISLFWFFSPIFLSSNSFFSSLLCSIFCSKLFVTKATPTHNIDRKSQIKKQRSCITCATRYYDLILHKWLFIASGADTHMHTDVMNESNYFSRNQVHAAAGAHLV